MDEQPNNQPPNKVVEKLTEWLIKASEHLMVWMQRLIVLLQKTWAWYQSIQWPKIPLTPLQWVLLFYAIFGILFLVSTPIFEASDELWHFGMVEAIRENNFALPEYDVSDPAKIYENNRDTIFRQEASQPPLYYVAAAVLISPFDFSDAEQYRLPNPHAQAGVPGSYGNKNLVLHEVGSPPLSGTPLAVYVLRLAGLAMGAGTVWSVYHCGKMIAPHRPIVGLVAAAFTAFNPMFIFISASVNNDNLVTLLNALAILLALHTMRDGFELRRSVAIAILVALASITKLSALVLIPVILLGAIWVARRSKDRQGMLILGAAILVAFAVIAGWWYVRNAQLYTMPNGWPDVFGTYTMAQVAGVRTDPFTLGTMLSEFQGFRLSYWGVFGAFNIQTTSLFYALADFVAFVALFGVLFLIAQLMSVRDFSFARRELTLILFLMGIGGLGLLAFLNWTSQTYATQGRLMFPFIAAISPLLAVGFVEVVWWILFLLSPPERSFLRAGEAVPEDTLNQSVRWPLYYLGVVAFLIPLTTIAPQYIAPQPLDALPENVSLIDADYGDIHLIAYEHVDRRYFPGESVRLTFYWQVEEQSDTDLSLGLTLLSPFGDRLGGIDTYPGAGSLRTSTWEVGKIYPDTYEITLSRATIARYPFTVQVHWYEEVPEEVLPMTTTSGDEIPDVVLNVGAVVTPNFPLNVSRFVSVEELRKDEETGDTLVLQTDRDFQGEILINGFDVDPRTFTIDLEWEARLSLEKDYTTFLHVLNDEDELVAQADVFPGLPTHYWRFGETYITSHHICCPEDLPPGRYRLFTGWYLNDGETYPRLLINPGSESEANTFELMWFEKRPDGLYMWPVYEVPERRDLTEPPDAEGTSEPQEVEIIDPNATEDLESLLPDGLLPEESIGTDEPGSNTEITEEAPTEEATTDIQD